MRWDSPVSMVGLIYRAGSARALFPYKIVVVFIITRPAGPPTKIFLRATKISANGAAYLLI